MASQDLLSPPFLMPDYQGNSLLNLMSSIIRSRGGKSPHPELNGLPAEQLSSCRRLIYLVIDGLGSAQLDEFRQTASSNSFFSRHESQTIDSIFPATTASAITTFMTGTSPLEHGILGWYLNLPDLGTTSTILLGESRTGMALVSEEFDFGAYLALPSHLNSVAQELSTLSYKNLANSRFSLATSNWQTKSGGTDLEQLEVEIAKIIASDSAGLTYVYWPRYDNVCHQHGSQSKEAKLYLEKIDSMLSNIERELKQTNSTLLVTADHGITDALPSGYIDLMSITGVPDYLTTLPCGDNGHAACFLRLGKAEAFSALVEKELGNACVIVTQAELLALGLLGPGEPHPKIKGRLGDIYLLARNGYCFIYPPAGHRPFKPKGYHGGMTRREVQIPLIKLIPD